MVPDCRQTGITMGLFDDLNKAMKQAEEEIKKSGLDQRMKYFEQGLNKAGKDIDQSLKNQPPGHPDATIPPHAPPASGARPPHPGYAKIAAWVKTNYRAKITALSDPFQKKLELEQISSEACSGMSSKAKKGFLDYLKSQNYEQLLK
jgi:hypothetical protein